MKNFFQSNLFKGMIIGLGIFIVLTLDFRAGMLFGYRQAIFSKNWGENYERNFIGPKGPGMMEFSRKGPMNTHGVSGEVIKIGESSLIVKGDGFDNAEKLIKIDSNTAIRRFRDSIKISDIKVGDNIIVVGSPNESGQIEAKLIRVIPLSSPRLNATSTKQ